MKQKKRKKEMPHQHRHALDQSDNRQPALEKCQARKLLERTVSHNSKLIFSAAKSKRNAETFWKEFRGRYSALQGVGSTIPHPRYKRP